MKPRYGWNRTSSRMNLLKSKRIGSSIPLAALMTGLMLMLALLTGCGSSVAVAGNAGLDSGRAGINSDAGGSKSGKDSPERASGSDSKAAVVSSDELDGTGASAGTGTSAGTCASAGIDAASSGESADELSSNARIRAEALLAGLTLERKAGQMLFPAYRSHDDGSSAAKADEDTLEAIRSLQPGGIAFFAENISDIQGTASLVAAFQSESDIPIFTGIDEEGGPVARIGSAEDLDATRLPDNATIGKTGNPDCARDAAIVIAREIGSLGFNLNFAPVCDVFSNPANKVIGRRAYGSDPEEVARMAVAAVSAYRTNGIVSVPKHFPGHGDTTADSHSALPLTEMDRETLERVSLAPFKAVIDAGAPMIMTAHISVPNAVENDLPATLNPEILTGLLREEMDFRGIILTDAMEMKAISDLFGETEACLRAIRAGADMVLMPTDPLAVRDAIAAAVRDGSLDESVVDRAVLRILTVKAEYGLLDVVVDVDERIEQAKQILGSAENLALAEKARNGGSTP